MSTESVKQFWQKTQNDPQLQARLQAKPTGNKEERLAEVVKAAAEAGFTFTTQDYGTALREEVVRQHAGAELRTEYLAQVAGFRPGVFNTDTTDCCTATSNSCDPDCAPPDSPTPPESPKRQIILSCAS